MVHPLASISGATYAAATIGDSPVGGEGLGSMTDVQVHLQALVQKPGDEAALASVESLFRSEGRWEELLRIYEDNALRGGRTVALSMLRRAAQVSLNELSSGPRA